MLTFKQEQAIAALNLTSLKPEDLLELWRRVNSSQTNIHDVREKVFPIFLRTSCRGDGAGRGGGGGIVLCLCEKRERIGKSIYKQ